MPNSSSRSPNWGGQNLSAQMPPYLPKLIAVAVVVFVLVILGAASSYIIEPGARGVKITLGKVEDQFLPEGFGFRTPFVTQIIPVTIKQRTVSLQAECFSSDLQQVTVELRVLYRVPESSVVQIFRQYAGDPFDSLIAPRVQGSHRRADGGLDRQTPRLRQNQRHRRRPFEDWRDSLRG